MTSFAYRLPDLWLGDIRSLSRLAEASQYVLEHPNLDFHALLLNSPAWEEADDTEEEDPLQEMMQTLAHNISFTAGSVGIVEVRGDLVQETSYANPWFGLVSYDTIVYAATMLAEDPGITDIVMSYDTPGGSAAGVDAAGKSLKKIGESKPVYSYSAGSAFSAGYWLAATGNRIYGPRTSEVGSIGAAITYMSISRMLEEDGIDVEVIRSGKYKALGGRLEPISAEAKAEMQRKVDTYTEFFTTHVASSRPVSSDDMSNWAQGKTFFMEEAVSNGLADGILDLSGLLTRLDKSQAGDNGSAQYRQSASSIMLSGGISMAKKLTVSPHNEAAPTVEANEASGVGINEAASILEPNDGAAGEVTVSAEGTAPAEPVLVTEITEATSEEEVGLGFFRSELTKTQAALAEATVALKASNEDVARHSAAVTVLEPIVTEAIADLQVRLGQSPSAMDNLSPADLAATYAATKKQFTDRYPVGQQSVPGGDSEPVPVEELAKQLGLRAVS